MTDPSCEEVRDAAPELVLGTLDGAERARLLEHVGSCVRCREEIVGLTDTVNDLGLLAPTMEPSDGFVERVLARAAATMDDPSAELVAVGSAPRRRRRSWTVLLAAAAAIIALGVGAVMRTPAASSGSIAVSAMVAPQSGQVMGAVSSLADGSVAVGVRYPSSWQDYELQAVHLDGTAVPLGPLWLDGDTWRWEGPIPDASSVDRVRVVRPDGQVTCWGRLPA